MKCTYFSSVFAIVLASYSLPAFAANVHCTGEIDDDPGTVVTISSFSKNGQEFLKVQTDRENHRTEGEYETMTLSIDKRSRNRLGDIVITGGVVAPKEYASLIGYSLRIPKIRTNAAKFQITDLDSGETSEEAWELKCD